MKKKVGIIGLGLMGQRRANAIKNKSDLIACCDVSLKKFNNFLNKINLNNRDKKKINFCLNWKSLIDDFNLDIIIISTFHKDLVKIMDYAYRRKKHILVEKPASNSFIKLKKFISSHKKNSSVIHVGYDHRFLDSVQLAQKLILKKKIGKLMFMKVNYGHGARIGYAKEWRFNPSISGGGQLIDQGSHAIDLSLFFLGNLKNIKSTIKSYFWKKKVDDNNFLILEFEKQLVSLVHTSCTEWKNTFNLELYGKSGKIKIFGKGGSYGPEKLVLYKMNTKKLGLPNIRQWTFDDKNKNKSFQKEYSFFLNLIKSKNYQKASLLAALKVLSVVRIIYKQNNYDYCS